MKLTVHRGTHQIGGSCVEPQSGGTRIVIDIGLPLTDKNGNEFNINKYNNLTGPELAKERVIPDVPGLYRWDKDNKPVDAILISHPHLDHYGVLSYVNHDIPLYMTGGCKSLITLSYSFKVDRSISPNIKVIKPQVPFRVGNFTITPYQVDHSGFDALAFLVEAEGKRVFYSGDFRGHGRKGKLYKELIKEPPENIDYLIMEGTLIGRGDSVNKTEKAIEDKLVKILKDNNVLAFLAMSSQNIDRIVTVFKACLRSGRTFVIDPYTAAVLDSLKNRSSMIPQYNWNNVRVYFSPGSHTKRLAEDGTLFKYKSAKISYPEIEREKHKLLIKDSWTTRKIFAKRGYLENSILIYSKWRGYLEKEKGFWDQLKVPIKYVHTSGHASVRELKQFANAINPGKIIPIHTKCPGGFHKYFGAKVIDINDEESIEI